MSRKLTEQQQQAIELLATGATIKDTAEAVGVSRKTASGWVNHHETFRRELQQVRADIGRSAHGVLAANAEKAARAVVEVLKDPEAKAAEKLRAAELLLDRAGVQSLVSEEMRQLSDEEIGRRIRAVYGVGADDDAPVTRLHAVEDEGA